MDSLRTFSKLQSRYVLLCVFSACLSFIASDRVFANGLPDTHNQLSDVAMLLESADTPISVDLSIARNYLVFADSNVVISQSVTNNLTGKLDSIRSFKEVIIYNQNILELVDVQNGPQMPLPDWNIGKSLTTPGQVQITAVSSGAALKTPGEILKLDFYVLTTAQPFDTSEFIASDIVFAPYNPVIVADTGLLRVIDTCTPVVSQGATPINSVMQLSQNPAAQSTSISYFISNTAGTINSVRFRLYNAAGNLMRTIDNAETSPGWHTLQLNLSNISNGDYELEFQSGAVHQIAQLLIIH